MNRPTIVQGGKHGIQVPASLVFLVPSTPFHGTTCKVFAWILWETNRRNLWPSVDDEPLGAIVRYCARDMLEGAGLASRNGYGELRKSMRQLRDARFSDTTAPLIIDYTERPGPHFDIALPTELFFAHARPLSRYALLSMQHIRNLKQSLDMALYARACLVARARHPRFEIGLDEIAWITGSTQHTSWRTLRRKVLASFIRVCAATQGRVVIQGWCSGDYPGIDRLLCHVGLATDTDLPRFHPRPQAIVLDVRPKGAFRVP
jgi:hypothetical protein